MKVAVIVNQSKSEAVKFAPVLMKKLFSLNMEILLLDEKKNNSMGESIRYFSDRDKIIRECDVVITVGGDGTIIHTAKYCMEYDKPLLGINFGRVGFVATMEKDEIDTLSKLLTNEYYCEHRMMLKITVENYVNTQVFYAVNDAVIARGSLSRMMDLSVSANNQKICDYRADGIIFATPTGSTAYSLSAGGPVISPDMECILMTPICPHSLFSRSVIFKKSDIITVGNIINPDRNGSEVESFLTVDGQYYIPLRNDSKIVIEKCDKPFKLIYINRKNFYEVLNEKLNERG